MNEADRTLLDADVFPFERALIGGLLLDGSGATIPPLLPDEFHCEGHRTIWAAIQDLDHERVPISPLTVQDRLVRSGTLEAAGGPAALAFGLLEGCVEVHRLRYAEIVRHAARQRALRRLGVELAQQGLDELEIQARLLALPGPLAPALFDPTEVMDRIMRSWQTLRVLTGLDPLDEVTGGMARGQVIAVVGITSHGKTGLLTDLARRIAAGGVRVEYMTLEETAEGIVRRLTAAMEDLSIHDVLVGQLTNEERARLAGAAWRLRALPLNVTATSALRSLRSEAVLGAVGRSSADVIIVDHLQKIQTATDSRAYGLEAVMNELHGVALRDGKVVLIAVQAGREANSQRRVPRESDCRDCGAVEMFARQVWSAYWPHKHDRKREVNEYELWVLKNSEGPTGLVRLRFQPRSGRFEIPGDWRPQESRDPF